MSPGGSRAYLTSPESKELVVVDTATRTVTRSFAVGIGPANMVLRGDG
ncbi:MAG: YncE family protein, partial [Candidatus Limnocylindrales bacterium]